MKERKRLQELTDTSDLRAWDQRGKRVTRHICICHGLVLNDSATVTAEITSSAKTDNMARTYVESTLYKNLGPRTDSEFSWDIISLDPRKKTIDQKLTDFGWNRRLGFLATTKKKTLRNENYGNSGRGLGVRS